MKNNKFVSLSDFKNTLVINGFNGEMIEKAEHKVHKYLRKEGGKYIYDYDKMNAKEHENASWEHHVQHIVNDTKAEGRKMAKDKELEEHYRKHAAYHKEEKEKHTKLAEEKKTGKKEDKTFDQQIDEHLESMKGKGVTEVHDSVMKKFKLNAKDASNQISRYLGNRNMLKKSNAFDILIPNDIDEILEKSKGPWKKGKKTSSEEGDHQFKRHEVSDKTKQALEGNDDASEAAQQRKQRKADKFLDVIRISDNSIKLKDVTVQATPKGNWEVFHEGKRLMVVQNNLLDEETIRTYNLEHHKAEKEKHTKLAEEKTDKIGDKLKLKGKEGEYEIRAINDKGVTLAKVGEKNSSLAMVHNVFRENKEDSHAKEEKSGRDKEKISKSEAFDILIPADIDEKLEKSRNEHNKPIGQTQSGKNVYHRYDHPEHKSFTKQDHTDAAQIHEDRAYLQYGKAYSKDKSGARTTGNNNRNAYGKMNYSQKQQAKHEAAAGSSENNE